jgi:hypothetical protein
MVEWWRRMGAGRPGTAPGCGGRRGEERGGARPEVGDGPDRWAPPVGGYERERRWSGPMVAVGPEGFVGRCDKNKEIVVGPRGKKVGLDQCCGFGFVVFFLFFFKSIFKPISNLFKFKSFTCFQILTQISPTILKAFHKPF